MDKNLIVAILLFVGTLFASGAISLAVLIGLPDDYFRTSQRPYSHFAAHGVLGRAGVVLKNVIGVILIVIGALLSLPGIPGQGLLTILAGIVLLDFPGRRRLLSKLLDRPPLLRFINRLRASFSRAPLLVD